MKGMRWIGTEIPTCNPTKVKKQYYLLSKRVLKKIETDKRIIFKVFFLNHPSFPYL